MRLDLLLALASVAVILSPCLMEILRKDEVEEEDQPQTYRWNSHNARRKP